MTRRINFASRLVKQWVASARTLQVELVARAGEPTLAAAGNSLRSELARDLSPDEVCDVLAQAAICAAPLLDDGQPGAIEWLSRSASPWERWVLEAASAPAMRSRCSAPGTESKLDAAHFYDQFLHGYAPASRKRHGVFFTPPSIAEYIVRQIDAMLQSEFGLPDGLASRNAPRFLDPACGTGVFLLAVIDFVHCRLGSGWNEFAGELLPRLAGIELLPVPALLAKLNIALKLAATGYDFHQSSPINIQIGDALVPHPKSEIRERQTAIPIVLGNPPFSSLSANTNPWIARLVRGDDEVRGYVQAGEQRLGERKTWLHDDYVKFIRLAQWHVEQAGRGIVGFVTNHGYLDNATFRLMRQELLRVFPRISLVDLHGNRKNGKVSPAGVHDENLFGLDQGVAIGILSRAGNDDEPQVDYAELWGTREAKIASLGDASLPACRLNPATPHWRLTPAASCEHAEYTAGWSLADAMPVHTTAPVTARDQFVVGFTEAELCERIAQFRDLSIPDDEIRRRYFQRTRSGRYPPGDSRGWKLGPARRAVAADDAWRGRIVRCLYRPFDWRYVFWHAAMIDWPRNSVTRHLLAAPNLCLIARRQQLPSQPCTYFWIADGLALDGVIRSDNRGSESLFPLRLLADDGRANFAPEFVAAIERRIGTLPTADDLLLYIYALFHSPTYRERYAEQLRGDFPRILLPRSGELFAELAAIGKGLIDLHLLRNGVGSLWRAKAVDDGTTPSAKDSRPHCDGFRLGGYDLPAKWLQPKHRTAGDPQYAPIAAAIDATRQQMTAIDAVIAQQGGFPCAFA